MDSIASCHPGGGATTDRVHALQDFTGSFDFAQDDTFLPTAYSLLVTFFRMDPIGFASRMTTRGKTYLRGRQILPTAYF